MNKLPNVVMDHLVEKDGWTHLDYAVAMDADYLVYDYVLDIFSRFWANIFLEKQDGVFTVIKLQIDGQLSHFST